LTKALLWFVDKCLYTNTAKKLVEVHVNNTVTIQCDDVLNIASVNLLHQDLKAAVNDADVIVLKADKVERVDASTLQVFAALFRDSEKLGIDVKIESPSAVMIESVKVVGLSKLFKLN